MDTITVAQNIAESVERELERLRAARPGLASRVDRAANIVATHLSCRRQRVIRVRVSGGVARFLVSGSKGAVYVVDPASWSCTCPDAHRHGKGCKHALACWALARAGGPPARRAGIVAACPVEIPVEALAVAESGGSYAVRECPGCYEGRVYDTGRGSWVDHDGCSGSGRARVFVYPKTGRLRECDSCRDRFAGGDLHEVREDHESLTFFEGDMLCGSCAAGHGVL